MLIATFKSKLIFNKFSKLKNLNCFKHHKFNKYVAGHKTQNISTTIFSYVFAMFFWRRRENRHRIPRPDTQFFWKIWPEKNAAARGAWKIGWENGGFYRLELAGDLPKNADHRIAPAHAAKGERLKNFYTKFWRFEQFLSEIDILVTRVNDFKFCVDLGLRISNFANLSISQNFNFSQILSKQFWLSQIFCGF